MRQRPGIPKIPFVIHIYTHYIFNRSIKSTIGPLDTLSLLVQSTKDVFDISEHDI